MSGKKALSAIEKMALAKRTGQRMSDAVKLDDEAIYKEVDEKEYKELVGKRRKEKDFIEGDDDLGYADDGEEHWDEELDDEEYADEADDRAASGSSAAPSAASARKPTGAMADGKAAKTPASNAKLVTSKLGNATETLKEKSTTKSSKKKDADIDDVFGELDAEYANKPVASAAPKSAGKRLSLLAASDYAAGVASSSSSSSAYGSSSSAAKPKPASGSSGAAQQAEVDNDYGDGGDGGGGDDDVQMDAAAGSTTSAAAGADDNAAAPTPAPERKSLLKKKQEEKEKAAAEAAAAAAAAEASKQQAAMMVGSTGDDQGSSTGLSLGTAGSQADGASGGGEVFSGTVRPFPFEKLKNKANVDVDSCLFYWLDAHEDPYKQPGVIHLFGRVMLNERAVIDAMRANAHVDMLARQRAERKARQEAKAKAIADGAASSAGTPAASQASQPAASTAMDEDDDGMMADAPLPAKRPVPNPEFASACLTINGHSRCCFILPREKRDTGEPVQLMDVYNEVKEGMRAVIPPGKGTFAIKSVQRNYAFELAGIPRETSSYMKLVYPAVFPALPPNLTSGKTYTHIFGTNATCMENFLLKRGLKGPCWLRVTSARNAPTPVSHCVFDMVVDDPKAIHVYGECMPKGWVPGSTSIKLPGPLDKVIVGEQALQLPTPDLTVLSLSLKTVLGAGGKQHEIVAASIVVHRQVSADGNSNENRSATSSLTIIRAPGKDGQGLPPRFVTMIATDGRYKDKIKYMPDERGVLNLLLAHISKIDPDVLVGHNINGFDLDVLLHRLSYHKIPAWSRIGRLRRQQMPRLATGVGGRDQFTGVLCAGRLVCDTYLAARELVRETTYALSYLAHSMLNVRREDIDPGDVPRYCSTPEDCIRLCQHTEDGAWLALALMFKLQVLPLTKQLTNLAGNLWSRSLKGARAERIEYLLLHEFHQEKYIVPDKERYADNKPSAKDEMEDLDGDDDDDDVPAAGRGGAKGKKKTTATGSGSAARFAKGRAKPSYAGGLVLEPKKGLYDKYVLLLDFQSLYPSIIQEYNICFTTVERQLKPLPSATAAEAAAATAKGRGKGSKAAGAGAGAGNKRKGRSSTGGAGGEDDGAAAGAEGGDEETAIVPAAEAAAAVVPAGDEDEDEDEGGGFTIPAVPDPTRYTKQGILPRVIRSLVLKRRQVKAQASNERDKGRKQQLDIRQKALKILANSMYGCLGFANSRFFAKPIAALVTSQGRGILQSTVELAMNKLSLEVIYGDTDSVMIHTNSNDLAAVKEMGNRMKREVNKLYKCLEIEIDGIFAMMLLLKKKKYAALKVVDIDAPLVPLPPTTPGAGAGAGSSSAVVPSIPLPKTSREVKGVDMVRRDWCGLSRQLGDKVLDIILSGREREDVVDSIHGLLTAVSTDMREGKVPLEAFVITKGLNKSPDDYPDANGQPHVQVAKALLKRGRPVNVGDHVPYVICQEPIGTVDLGVTTGGPQSTSPVPSSAAGASGAGAPSPSSPGGLQPMGISASSASAASALPQNQSGSLSPAAVSPSSSPATSPASSPQQSGGAGAAATVAATPAPSSSSSAAAAAAAGPASPASPSTSSPTQPPPSSTSPSGAAGAPKPTSSSSSIVQRAYHPDDVKRAAGRLHVDLEWYLSNQILPPIARLCEPIEGTSQARIAEVLGLDSSRFNRLVGLGGGSGAGREEELGTQPFSTLPDEERFKGCDPLLVKCLKCGSEAPFPGVYGPMPPQPGAAAATGAAADLVRSGLHCTKPGCNGFWGSRDGPAPPKSYVAVDTCAARLQNAVTLAVRRNLAMLQAGWSCCEDGLCATRTRGMSTRKAGYACVRRGCNNTVRAEYDATSAHRQLQYYASLFDAARTMKKREKTGQTAPGLTDPHRKVFDVCLAEVERHLHHSAHHSVNEVSLFASIVSKTNVEARMRLKIEDRRHPVLRMMSEGVSAPQSSTGWRHGSSLPRAAAAAAGWVRDNLQGGAGSSRAGSGGARAVRQRTGDE